jgi:tetratricopeptide (TPR) repeat protein
MPETRELDRDAPVLTDYHAPLTAGFKCYRRRSRILKVKMNLKLKRHWADMSTMARVAGMVSLAGLYVSLGWAQSDSGRELPAAQGTPAKTPPAAVISLPEPGLTDRILYQYLISEIAGQRGRVGLALRGLTDLAQKTRDPRLARRAVELAFQARELTLALDATTLWLELEPDSAVARQALAALVGTQGTLDSAKTSIAAMLTQPGRTAAILLQVNPLLSRFADKSAVADAVKALSAPYLEIPEAHYAIALSLLAAKDSAGALRAINEALQRRVDWAQAAILKSQILRDAPGERATEYLAQFLAKYPNANEVRQNYARLLVAQKAYRAAREQFRISAKNQPTDPEIPYAVGLLSQQIEDFADAEFQFRRVLELGPRDSNPVFFNLGVVAEGQKRQEAAIDWYRRISAGEYFVTAQLKIGHILAKRDGIDAGRKHLREAQMAESDAPDTRIQLILAEAQLLRDIKALPEAFKFLSEAIQKDPDTADLLYDRAMVAEKIDRLEVMEADLRRVIELKPEHAHAYNALGYTLAERNQRLPEAFELVQKALTISPNDAFIQDSLGWVQFRLGRTDDALKTLRGAYLLRRDPEIAAHLGEILWARGDREEAWKVWRSSLVENPDSEVLASVMKKFTP